jgi:predicted TIM-barrel fold metal-dependent hydrolase
MTTQSRQSAEDLILISVDDHICEPADMFTRQVPARWRDQAPRVVDEPNGSQQWYYGEARGRNLGLNAVAGKPREYFNIDASRYEQMRPGCYDVHERVRDMSAGGQLAGLNFPNWTGFSGQVLNQGPDRDLNLIMIQAYNDWHIDEWCAAYPERFIPCGMLPLFDVQLAAAELRRLAAKGCHAVTFSENPEALAMPSIHTRHWDPLYEAACEEGTVLCLHVGSASRSPSLLTTSDAPASVAMNLSPLMSTISMVELIWADLWSRFPTLRFSLTEGDIGWIPYFLWRAEHSYRRHGGWTKASFPAGYSGPTDVFRKHFLSCFISDPIGVKLLGEFDTDNVCWESDFPHSDSNWPNAPEELTAIFGNAGVDDATVNKVTHENAMRHYKFDPFAIRGRDKCTVGALRSEATDVDVVTRVGREADDRDLAAWHTMTSRSRGSGATATK